MSENESKITDRWTMPWIDLKVHELLWTHINAVAAGEDNLVVTGPKGLGKSQSTRRLLKRFEKEERQRREVRSGTERPRKYKMYASGRADGSKSALRDLMGALGYPLSDRDWRSSTPTRIIEDVVAVMKGPAGTRGLRMICIDEADEISPSNLDDLRKVLDKGEQSGYPIGMILIGNGPVAESLKANKELGERFGVSLTFSPPNEQLVIDNLPTLHPHLAILSEAPGWDALSDRILNHMEGSWRRLEKLITAANRYANTKGTPLDENAFKFAFLTRARE